MAISFLEKILHVILQSQKRPGGEIGRRTVFRWQRSQGRAGSNPVPGTNSPQETAGFFFSQC